MAGGAVLSLGNLATQYALAFVGLSVTEVINCSIAVVLVCKYRWPLLSRKSGGVRCATKGANRGGPKAGGGETSGSWAEKATGFSYCDYSARGKKKEGAFLAGACSSLVATGGIQEPITRQERIQQKPLVLLPPLALTWNRKKKKPNCLLCPAPACFWSASSSVSICTVRFASLLNGQDPTCLYQIKACQK
ncbi:hypothetical protein IEQ34_007276 [Dendrobium chrysotoxum]|uniref:Uncharacterized protein n=1 Tax=Dendrobium chrysotoxum TaxID=161865 RepID=A0AAV7GRM1_DENCH|nr:hypothetical protein IEQ34_007276 [Dendrobium chrysotoxum]